MVTVGKLKQGFGSLNHPQAGLTSMDYHFHSRELDGITSQSVFVL
jgi:hypothetical protein